MHRRKTHREMDALLIELDELCKELGESSSVKLKKDILKRRLVNEPLRDLIAYIYNPYTSFGITSKSVLKSKDNDVQLELGDIVPGTLLELLQMLNSREITGNRAIRTIKLFIQNNSKYEQLILGSIDKKLNIRVGVSIINSSVGYNLIPVFSVALCEEYQPYNNIVFETEDWYASRKLDGCRCILRKEGDEVTVWSRRGREFTTLDVLRESLKNVEGDFVLDGEICIVDENGDEDFQSIMRYINRKNYTIPNPMYKVFDMLTLEEFDTQSSTRLFTKRQEALKELLEQDIEHVSLNEQTQLHSKEEFEEMREIARSKNWEGIVIRRDTVYEGYRTPNMLKCKDFKDAEYTVVGVEFGNMSVVVEDTTINMDILTSVEIIHKGCKVNVGSGFTLDQREYYRRHPEEIIGKEITVKYFEETKNMSGGYSLRFPTVVYIHDGVREV